MTARAHSVLGASSAYRWMACPGSVRLSEGIENRTSSFAKEGTAAHAVGEACLHRGDDAAEFIGWLYDHGLSALVNPTVFKTPSDDVTEITEDMAEAVQVYIDAVRDALQPGDVLVIERRFDLSRFKPGLFGTNDASIYRPATGELIVFDYKHGQGVAVEVEDNPQLLYYGLGAATAEKGRRLSAVELVIVQPRCPHPAGPVRRWKVDAVDLLEWSSDLVAAAERTEAPNAPLSAGDHCRFCPAAPVCPALYRKVLDTAMAEFDDAGNPELPQPETLGHNSLGEILRHVDMIKAWCKSVQEYAHAELEAGRSVPGFKLVANRAVRRWKDENTAVEYLRLYGLEDDEIFTEPKLKSPAQIEKVLRKDKGAIADLVEKKSSGTIVVPEDDPREAVKPEAAAEFEAVED